jgi:hypothetical protein
MVGCTALLEKQLRIIADSSAMRAMKLSSGEDEFNPHGPVIYTVRQTHCSILKRDGKGTFESP